MSSGPVGEAAALRHALRVVRGWFDDPLTFSTEGAGRLLEDCSYSATFDRDGQNMTTNETPETTPPGYSGADNDTGQVTGAAGEDRPGRGSRGVAGSPGGAA